MGVKTDNNINSEVKIVENETKQYLVTNSNYELIKQYQQLIYEKTEVSLAFR